MSQSSNHLRLVSWTWQWVHFTQMASTVTRSQSNRAPLGCGGMGDSNSSPPAVAHFSTQGSGSPITARSVVPCSQEPWILSLVVPTGIVLKNFVLSVLSMETRLGQAVPLLSWRWKRLLRDPVRAPDITSCPEWNSTSKSSPRRASCSCGLSCSCV